MTVGRKPIPSNVHDLRGTYRKHRHERASEPLLPPASLEAPDWLPDAARTEWCRVVKVLEPAQVLTEGDTALLMAYCLLFADVKALGGRGLPIPPPAVAQLRLCAAELGLTPSSRQRLATGRPKEANEFAGFGPPGLR